MTEWAWPHLSSYIALNGSGLIVGLILLDRALTRRIPGSADRAYCLCVLVLPFAWLGAHALDAAVNHRPLTTAGFVFYGGLISGGVIFYAFGRWLLGTGPAMSAANAAVVPLVVAHAFGRVGCFFAGCCYGRPMRACGVETRHPTQLYEAGFLVMLAASLVLVGRRRPESELGMYLTCYPAFRFCIEALRDDQRGGVWDLSTSQLVSVLILVAVAMRWCVELRAARIGPLGAAARPSSG